MQYANLSRYYYAIVTCDTTEAASHIYEELEGTELERSANVFDISFVPEAMSFEDEPRCAKLYCIHLMLSHSFLATRLQRKMLVQTTRPWIS
jgi:hypothetical protein